jgi:3-hydroxy-9,10-secoandrosta-1,3,5(10)-triene-9,17-dione monooxygenase reductase component
MIPTIELAAGPPAVIARPQEYREAWARLASAVYVVAGADEDGPYGATASSVCSLSLDPPLLLVCLDNRSRTLARLLAGGVFAVNALPAHQGFLADRFATRAGGEDKFRGVEYRLRSGVPVLEDAVAWFVCHLHASFDGGDHTIVVGAVAALHQLGGEPLVRHDHRYRSLS